MHRLACFILLLPLPGLSQPEKVYTSLEEALLNKDQVYQLDISGAQKSEFTAAVCELTNLKVLNASFKHLQELPECIGELTQLRVLNLWTSDLETLPESIGQLENLATLILGYNRFSVFPDIICRLPKLERLEMPGNWLTTLPDSLSGMEQLRHVDFSFNRFSQFPIGLTTAPALEFIDLGYNDLTTLPAEIVNMENLKTFILTKNEIATLPDNLSEMKGLGTMNLSENHLEGVPPSLACWYDHGKINFDYNRFHPFSTFVIVDTEAAVTKEIFFGDLAFLADSACEELDHLFDALGVMRLENAVELVKTDHGNIDSATLFLPVAASTAEWELFTRPEYEYTSSRQFYFKNWKVIRMNAVTGELVEVSKRREKLFYGPEPY